MGDLAGGRSLSARAPRFPPGRDVALARSQKTELDKAALIPHGRELAKRENQIAPEITAAPRFRRVYGFISGAALASSSGTGRPLQFAVVLRLPCYVSGSVSRSRENRERGAIWAYGRTWACAPLACRGAPALSWRSGGPISGVIGIRGSAQQSRSSMLEGMSLFFRAGWPGRLCEI